jgi:hypothetical protein
VLGLLVTLLGIYLVVRQLKEARLASQMEGMLALGDRFDGLLEHIIVLNELTKSDRWQAADSEEALGIIYESTETREAFFKVGSYYEGLAVLVRRKVLDEQLAYDSNGSLIYKRWKWVDKAVFAHRIAQGAEDYWEHWEWLAERFRDYDGKAR